MFKTFQGTNPTGESLAGYEPTVGWVVINDGTYPLTFGFTGIPGEAFTVNPGEMMRLPIPLADAVINGTSRYRAIAFGLASLFHEFGRELPGRLVMAAPPSPTSNISSADLVASEGAAATPELSEVTNAPMVAVHVDLTADATKYWQADRPYRLFQLFLNKTVANGVLETDYLDVLYLAPGGEDYVTVVDGPRDLEVPQHGCAALDYLSVQEIAEGGRLQFVSSGANSSCKLHLLLVPLAP